MKRAFLPVFAFVAIAMMRSPIHASTTYSIAPANISAQPGDVGDSFDVLFTNNGPTALSVAAFTFEVSVSDPDITLTGADYSTSPAPYIFTGDSFDQDISTPLNFVNVDGYSPQILDAGDLTYDDAGINIAAGESISLGRVLFDVANPAQPGPFSVSFTGEVSNVANANNMSDPNGDLIPVDSFSSGIINVAAVPEPASLLPMLLTLAIPAQRMLMRRRAATN